MVRTQISEEAVGWHIVIRSTCAGRERERGKVRGGMARSMKIPWHCWSPEQLVTHFSKHSFLNCYLKFLSEDFAGSVTLEWGWWELACLLEQDAVAE